MNGQTGPPQQSIFELQMQIENLIIDLQIKKQFSYAST
jgi:hypothetical protein